MCIASKSCFSSKVIRTDWSVCPIGRHSSSAVMKNGRKASLSRKTTRKIARSEFMTVRRCFCCSLNWPDILSSFKIFPKYLTDLFSKNFALLIVMIHCKIQRSHDWFLLKRIFLDHNSFQIDKSFYLLLSLFPIFLLILTSPLRKQ